MNVDETIENLCDAIFAVIRSYAGKDYAYDCMDGDDDISNTFEDGSKFCIRTVVTKFVKEELKRPEKNNIVLLYNVGI